MRKSKYEERKNEEIRIIALGPISEYLNSATLPDKLSFKSQKVARIGLGSNHAVFLFMGSELAISGKNDKGQLGLPIKEKDEDNTYNGLTLVNYKVFEENQVRVIDVAAGTNHTMFLTEPIDDNPVHEGETREVYVCGDRNMIGRFTTSHADKPKVVELERFREDPELRIKFIYSSNEKCIVVDNKNGMTIWGRNFEGKHFKVK
jgi:alpha-tubulin suppressor-like RCC1 family protein